MNFKVVVAGENIPSEPKQINQLLWAMSYRESFTRDQARAAFEEQGRLYVEKRLESGELDEHSKELHRQTWHLFVDIRDHIDYWIEEAVKCGYVQQIEPTSLMSKM